MDNAEQNQAEAEPTMPDLEAVYDEKIFPLMAQILAVCKEHDLPMVAAFQFSTTGFCSSLIAPQHADKRIRMADSFLRNGFLAYMTTTQPSVAPDR